MRVGIVAAIKTGALGNAETLQVVRRCLEATTAPIVVDPVMSSTSGAAFGDAGGAEFYRTQLLPLASVFTPNAIEASQLLGSDVRTVEDAEEAGLALRALGADAVLLKGGHLRSEGDEIVDVWVDAEGPVRWRGSRGPRCRGTGCALSASIAARLALGSPPKAAALGATQWLRRAIHRSRLQRRGTPTIDFFTPMDDEG